MAIREALERGPSDRQRQLILNPFIGGMEQRSLMTGECRRILENSPVPEVFAELRDAIATTFPDARFVEMPDWVQPFSLQLGWNFHSKQEGSNRYTYDAIEAIPNPLTEEIVIVRKGEGVVFTEGEVLTKKQLAAIDARAKIEDVAVWAYQRPLTFAGPPINIF